MVIEPAVSFGDACTRCECEEIWHRPDCRGVFYEGCAAHCAAYENNRTGHVITDVGTGDAI